MVDFALSGEQRTLRDTIRRWAMSAAASSEDHAAAVGLADVAGLGLLGLGADPAEGGAVDLYVAMVELGRAAYPGPLVPAVVAAALLDGQRRQAVTEGRLRVGLVVGDLVPAAGECDITLALDDDRAWEVRPATSGEQVRNASGELWSRGAPELIADLGDSRAARIVRDVATAGYLSGAAHHQLDASGRYAEVRTQFGERLIDFQAVAHPISQALVDLVVAESLALVAAAEHDRCEGADGTVVTHALAARLAAVRAALRATYVAHQAMGAIGYTLEGPLARHTLRIRQVALSVPVSSDERRLLDRLAGLEEADGIRS